MPYSGCLNTSRLELVKRNPAYIAFDFSFSTFVNFDADSTDNTSAELKSTESDKKTASSESKLMNSTELFSVLASLEALPATEVNDNTINNKKPNRRFIGAKIKNPLDNPKGLMFYVLTIKE